jgi:hypothetical protein
MWNDLVIETAAAAQAEAKLREQEAKYRALFASLDAGSPSLR